MKTLREQHSVRPIQDLHLAAFLLSRGYRLVGFEPGPKARFIFELPEDAVIGFFGGDDRVSARALLNALRDLKGLLHSHAAGVRNG